MLSGPARRSSVMATVLLLLATVTVSALAERPPSSETVAVRTLRHLVSEEKQYFVNHSGEYASYIIGTGRQLGGLIEAGGEPDSFTTVDLKANRRLWGQRGERPDNSLVAYRGYYYRVLEKQGANALGGAKPYAVHGRMTEGFALLAFPIDYGKSGVNTFIVNESGQVLYKDLGKKTMHLVGNMTEFNPDSSWQTSEELSDISAPARGQWQVGTVVAVKVHQPDSGKTVVTSYEVSMKIGETVFVVLCTPRYDTGTALSGSGRELNVLVGDKMITYNDILGNPVQDPILARSAATTPSF